ncbi:MAG: hypothetical protein H6525_10145 [Actinobacteria bacterium]|nr:hypothetical protein [Actinomycetota bacterium]
MRLWVGFAGVALVGTVALAGCSSQDSAGGSESASAEPATSAPVSAAPTGSAQPGAADDSACQLADATGESNNAELQALATAVFNDLDCAAAESLGDQLKAAAADPEFTAQVAAAGWESSSGEAVGGVSLSVVDVEGRTTCMISVLDSPKAKTLNCGNV